VRRRVGKRRIGMDLIVMAEPGWKEGDNIVIDVRACVWNFMNP
jgi:hypothetical protein